MADENRTPNYENVPLSALNDATAFTHKLIAVRGHEVTVEFTSIANGVTTLRTLSANRTPYAAAVAEKHDFAKAKATREAAEAAERARMNGAAYQMFGPAIRPTTTHKPGGSELLSAAEMQERKAANDARRAAGKAKRDAKKAVAKTAKPKKVTKDEEKKAKKQR